VCVQQRVAILIQGNINQKDPRKMTNNQARQAGEERGRREWSGVKRRRTILEPLPV
jgi:hypothetical protein